MALNNFIFEAFHKFIFGQRSMAIIYGFLRIMSAIISTASSLAVSGFCQKLSPMHLEAELFLIVNKTFRHTQLISTPV